MMNQSAFEKWVAEFTSELNFAKEHYKQRVWSILKRNAKALAQLSEGQIRVVIEIVIKEHFCEEKDLRKAIIFGKGEMPEPVFDCKQISLKTWQKFPQSAKKTLSNATNTIMMKKGNSVVPVPVASLPKMKDSEVRKVFSANHPEWGLLGPEENLDRTVKPKYYTLIEAVLDAEGEVLLTSRMMGTTTLCKTRVKIDELKDVVKAVSDGQSWKR
jgi:hypothetical protein